MSSSRLLKIVQKTTPVIVGRNPKPTTTNTTIIRRPPPQSSSSSTIPPPPPPVIPPSRPSIIPPPRPSIISPLSYLRASSSYIPPPLIPHLRVRPPASYFTPASSSIVTPPLLSSSSSSLIRNIYPDSYIHHEAVIPEDGGFLGEYFPPDVFGSLSRAQSKVIQFLMSGGWYMGGLFVGGPSLAQINLFFQTINAMREAYEALQPYGLALAERIKARCLYLFKKKKNNNNEIQQPQQLQQVQQQQEEEITVPCFQLLSEPNRIKFACLLFGVTDKDCIGFQILDNKTLVINAIVASGKDLDPLTATLDLPPGDFSNAQTNTKFSKKNGIFLIDIRGFQITNSSSSSS